jgi:hypothetical protein
MVIPLSNFRLGLKIKMGILETVWLKYRPQLYRY